MELVSDDLIYRRQFLLARGSVKLFSKWRHLIVGNYQLYSHPDLEVNVIDKKEKRIALIGSIFDPSRYEDSNSTILKRLYAKSESIHDLFKHVKKCAGRYALLYEDARDTIIFNDALTLREIFFCTGNNLIICGSQPNFVATYAKPEIVPRNDNEFREFYTSHAKDLRWNPIYKWVGDETYYEGIKHLMPNHYLDIRDLQVKRYWPGEPIRALELNEAVLKSCAFLQGSLKAVAKRHKIMMAVTAGTDSRTLLAASRSISDKIYYFVNNEHAGKKYSDVEVPREMFGKLGIPFHIHAVPNDMNEEFRKRFLNNAFFASDRIVRTIYNVYFKKLSDRVNVLGVGEIGRTRYGDEPKPLNSYALVYKQGHRKGRYVMSQGEKILGELLPVSRAYGINLMTLFYWEHTLGNWGATGNSESDIAIEEINPYDSHLLYEVFLGVDPKYTKYTNPILFKEMISHMWPELLNWPINPPYTVKAKAIELFLVRTGLFEPMKRLKYKLCYVKWCLSQK